MSVLFMFNRDATHTSHTKELSIITQHTGLTSAFQEPWNDNYGLLPREASVANHILKLPFENRDTSSVLMPTSEYAVQNKGRHTQA